MGNIFTNMHIERISDRKLPIAKQTTIGCFFIEIRALAPRQKAPFRFCRKLVTLDSR